MDTPSRLLLLLGVGFFCANLRLLSQFVRYLKIRSSALLTWPGRKPPFYGLLLVLGAVLALLIVYKLAVLRQHPIQVFGESMMLVYYAYALPLSLRIGRGFYQDGIWADGGFIPYSRIGGLSWREGEQVTLVMIYRMRAFARALVCPTGITAPRGACSATRSLRTTSISRGKRWTSAWTTGGKFEC